MGLLLCRCCGIKQYDGDAAANPPPVYYNNPLQQQQAIAAAAQQAVAAANGATQPVAAAAAAAQARQFQQRLAVLLGAAAGAGTGPANAINVNSDDEEEDTNVPPPVVPAVPLEANTNIGNKQKGLYTRRSAAAGISDSGEDDVSYYDEVVLKSSHQCVALVRYNASIADEANSWSFGNELLHKYHVGLQLLVDGLFNETDDGEVKQTPVRRPMSKTDHHSGSMQWQQQIFMEDKKSSNP